MSIPEKYRELGFDVVLPSHLLINPNLEPNAKLLYGLIRNLTRIEGYCYATNQYLSEAMEVDIRTIQRWLDSLEKEGYIDRKQDKGFNPLRKIYLSDNFKKCLHNDKNVRPPRQKCPPKEDIKHKKEEKKNPPSPQREAVCEEISFGSHVRLKKEEYEDFCSLHGKQFMDELIGEMNDYILSRKEKPYKDYAAALRNWIRRRKASPINAVFQKNVVDVANNKKIANDIIEEFGEKIGKESVSLCGEGIEFTFASHYWLLKFTDSQFKEKLQERLKKAHG